MLLQLINQHKKVENENKPRSLHALYIVINNYTISQILCYSHECFTIVFSMEVLFPHLYHCERKNSERTHTHTHTNSHLKDA